MASSCEIASEFFRLPALVENLVFLQRFTDNFVSQDPGKWLLNGGWQLTNIGFTVNKRYSGHRAVIAKGTSKNPTKYTTYIFPVCKRWNHLESLGKLS